MKYLYKIFRLFFCPHKFGKLLAKGPIANEKGERFAHYYDKECNYCGKVRSFNV